MFIIWTFVTLERAYSMIEYYSHFLASHVHIKAWHSALHDVGFNLLSPKADTHIRPSQISR